MITFRRYFQKNFTQEQITEINAATAEMIRDIEVRRKLEAQIQQVIFGSPVEWCWCVLNDTDTNLVECQSALGNGYDYSAGMYIKDPCYLFADTWLTVPFYTIDIAAAWRVAMELHRPSVEGENIQECREALERFQEVMRERDIISMTDEEVAEYICQTALNAKGISSV